MRDRLRNMKHQQGKIRKDIPEAMRGMFSLLFDNQAVKTLGYGQEKMMCFQI